MARMMARGLLLLAALLASLAPHAAAERIVYQTYMQIVNRLLALEARHPEFAEVSHPALANTRAVWCLTTSQRAGVHGTGPLSGPRPIAWIMWERCATAASPNCAVFAVLCDARAVPCTVSRHRRGR